MHGNQRLPIYRQARQKDYLYSKGVTSPQAFVGNYLEERKGSYRPLYKATTTSFPVSTEAVLILGANLARADLLLQNKGTNDLHLAFDAVPQINGASIKLEPNAVWGFSNNGITPNMSNLYAIADGGDALLAINETIQIE